MFFYTFCAQIHFVDKTPLFTHKAPHTHISFAFTTVMVFKLLA